jgi:hypothetical protein
MQEAVDRVMQAYVLMVTLSREELAGQKAAFESTLVGSKGTRTTKAIPNCRARVGSRGL